MNLKNLLIFFSLLFMGILTFSSCGEDTPPEPEPVTLAFTLQSATLNGDAITPTPSYTLTLTFDVEGEPDGYTAAGDATFQPSVGTSGTFSIASNQITFTSGANTRTVTISSGTLSAESTSVSLQWDLTKIDDGVTADEQGTYVYQMAI